MLLQQLYEHKLKEYRARIDARLEEIITSESDPSVKEMLAYALGSGRRFRPLLFLLAYKVLGREIDEKAYRLATAIELLHKASLLHDDLIDDDSFRRGRATFHAKYGAATAIIVGDLLVAEASLRFSQIATVGQVRSWLRQYRTLCYGELLDVMGVEGACDEERVESIIYGKTASFLEFIMQVAAESAGAGEREAELLAEFGKHIGFVFQILNDWNNWSGFEEQVGRQSGSDLDRGKVNHISLILASRCESAASLENEVRAVVEGHSESARRALEALGFTNKYVWWLKKTLEDKYASWYWVDRDHS